VGGTAFATLTRLTNEAIKMRWKQKTASRQTMWMLVGAGAAMIAGQLMERGLETGWRKARDEDPPEHPWKRGQTWPAALGWAALSGAAVAATQLAARRGAHVGLRRITGKRPPAGV
jgi:hypothetical protein